MNVKIRSNWNSRDITPAWIHLGDSMGNRFFALYREDCYSPGIALIRAENFQEALDIFAEYHPESDAVEEILRDIMLENSEFNPWKTDIGYSEAVDKLESLHEEELSRLREIAFEKALSDGSIGINDGGTLYSAELIQGWEIRDPLEEIRWKSTHVEPPMRWDAKEQRRVYA